MKGFSRLLLFHSSREKTGEFYAARGMQRIYRKLGSCPFGGGERIERSGPVEVLVSSSRLEYVLRELPMASWREVFPDMPATVLVVDDTATERHIASSSLQKGRGLSVTYAADGREALTAIER